MVNGFIKEGKMSDKDINHITPKIKSSIEKSLSEDKAVITDCCTDICVMNLAIPLLNYFDEHYRYEYNRVALRLMKNQGIGVENI